MCVVYGFFRGFVLLYDVVHDLVFFGHNGVVVLESGVWVEDDLVEACYFEF